jgi:hypothetical protein
MTIRLLAPTFVAAIVAGIPAPGSGWVILPGRWRGLIRKVIWLLVLATIPLFPAPSGAIPILSINGTPFNLTGKQFTDSAGRPAYDITLTSGIFTISGSSLGLKPEIAVVEGTTVDQLILTNAVIKNATGATGTSSTINITFSNAFLPISTSQTLPAGVSTSGTFSRGFSVASGDKITVQGFVGFADSSCDVGPCFSQIGSDVTYLVPAPPAALTANSFAPTTPPQSTGSFSCNGITDVTCSPSSQSDLLKTIASITLRSGDSLKLASGGIVTVACRNEDIDCPAAFQAGPELPEPSTLLLVVSAISGLGLFGRKYGGSKPARPLRTTRPAE